MHEPVREPVAAPVPLDPRIYRKCESVALKAVGALPELLSQCQPEQAAELVVDLVKTLISRPHFTEKADPLAVVIERLKQMEERREAQKLAAGTYCQPNP